MVRAAIDTVGFFFLAPGTTAGLVPWWLTGWDRPDVSVGAVDVLGVALIVAGLAVVIACFTRFVTEGTGTPAPTAPTAPTESLVVGGLYRHVRNPMYLAVASVIGGQALLLRSPPVGVWLLAFMATVWTFVHVYEEPALTEQLGATYERYRSAVPGWWPRLRPYRG